MNYQGYIIYRERLRRNWSQEGLCKGICTVSYLSKIETGKAEPSEEVLRLLFERLDLNSNKEIEQEASELAGKGWELLFDFRLDQLKDLIQATKIERYNATPYWLDLALLSSDIPLDATLESCMNTRQLSLQRILQGKEIEAVRLEPCAYTYLMLGIADYKVGNYSSSIDALQTAYDLASREGRVKIMLNAKLFLGNAYGNQQDIPNMKRHYQIGRRLAEDLQDQRALHYRIEIPNKKKFGFVFFVYQVYEAMDMCLLWLPYPLMLINRGICGFLGSNSAIMRSAAVQRYIPERLRSRVNAFEGVLITAGASAFSLLMGLLGEMLDYRLCVTIGGSIAMIASWILILGRRKDVQRIYEQKGEAMPEAI